MTRTQRWPPAEDAVVEVETVDRMERRMACQEAGLFPSGDSGQASCKAAKSVTIQSEYPGNSETQ